MTDQPDRLDEDEDRDAALPEALRDAFAVVAARHRGGPSAGVLRAADAGALAPPDQDAVAADLASSRWSQAMVRGANAATAEAALDDESVARLLARVHRDSAESTVVPMRPRSSPRAAIYSVIGIAAAAVIGFTVVMRRDAAAPAGPAGPGPATPPASVAAPAAPAFHLAIEAPAVKLTARALVLRSQGTSSAFVDQIAPAIAAYRAGRYHEAATAFAAIAPRYPASVEVAFYHGVSQLLDGDAAGATASLKAAAALADPTFADDVAWYLAAAEERTGDVPSARSGLEALCHGTSVYAARACDAVARLPR